MVAPVAIAVVVVAVVPSLVLVDEYDSNREDTDDVHRTVPGRTKQNRVAEERTKML